MDTSPRIQRFIYTTAVGALLIYAVCAVCATLAFAVPYTAFDPHMLIAHTLPLIWLPFAVAAFCLVVLTLAAGIRVALVASRSGQDWWSTTFRLLVAVAIIAPLMLALTRNLLLVLIVALAYLVLPALALLAIGRRTGPRLLATTACVAYGLTIVLLILTYEYPRFGIDPNQIYDIYFPPQFSAAIIVLVVGLFFSVAAGIVCAVDARLAGRRRWSNSFQIAVAAGLLSPIALLTQTHYPPIIPLPATLEVTLAILAAASYLALPVMALIYLRKPSLPASTIGMPHVSTSL